MKSYFYLFCTILCITFCLDSCKTNDGICTNPDKYASFGNGIADFSAYMLKTNGIDTCEITTFRYDLTIDKKGKIIEIKSHNEKCITDSLMIDHLLNMPKWNPAIKGNKKVKSIYPLKFNVRPQ